MGRSNLQVADFIQKLFVAGSCIAELFKDIGNPDLIESSPYLPHWYVDLVVFTRIAGTSKTGSGRYWC